MSRPARSLPFPAARAAGHGLLAAVLCLAALMPAAAAPSAKGAPPKAYSFGVVGHTFKNVSDESALKRGVEELNQGNPAFIVATGIKAATEPCSDKLYSQRRAILAASEAPMVVSLAGSDWSACLNSAGRSNAIERLNRLRELFYPDSESLGLRQLGVTRLSSSAKFRSYAENSHWEVGKVLYATINLPANNNHYRPEAGRNSEYEDRLVANRAWLHRLFTLAQREKLHGLVLFSDGDAGVLQEEGFSLLKSFNTKQDGYAEPRRQIRAMAEKFQGKVLLVDAQGGNAEPVIQWRGNVGHLGVGSAWVEVKVRPGDAALFTLKGGAEPQ
ncbi:hypothetical protein ACLB1G_15020 [Oxalobacteraceae bacterium A2-2]